MLTGCKTEVTPREYTLIYDPNGGSGQMNPQIAVEGSEIPLTANTFTREGYTFTGWNTAANGKGTDYADKSTVRLTENLTLYAQWNKAETKISYTVKFDANGGEGKLPADITATAGGEFTLPAAELTKTGYDFKGWCATANGTGTTYEAGSKAKDLSTENGATVTLYAKWVLHGSWSINYVLNGDEATPAQNAETNPAYYNIETAAITLADPTRNLYEFAGWYDNAEFTGEKLSGWKAGEKTGDITLYAKWVITAGSVSEAIKNIPADGNVHTVALVGEIFEDIITAIRKALIAKPEIKVNLDLSGTTGLTEIPEDAFYDSDECVACEALAGIVLPEGIESINRYAFRQCSNLTDIVIPDSVKTIGNLAFGLSGLTSIKFGSGLESIGEWAFQVCNSLTKITVPGNVKTIVHGAFGSCDNLEEAVLEKGVQTIGETAFTDCPKLATVTIPKSVTSIGDMAFSFSGGTSLQTVNYGGTMAEWNALKASIGTSNDVLLNAAIYCTDGSLNTDAVSVINRLGEGEHTVTVTGEISAEYLAEIANAIKNKGYSGTKIILDMSGTTGLESVPEMTFNANFGLARIVLPQSVTSIGNLAFVNCTSLTSIEIPDNVTSVGVQSFQACESLKDATLGKGITSISSSMFFRCSALERIVIPAKVESIEPAAFDDCTKLTDVYYGGTVAEWNALKDNGKISDTGNDALFNATVHCSDEIVTAATNTAELIASLESGEYNITVTGELTDVSAIKTALQSNEAAKVSLDLSQTTGLTSIGDNAFGRCNSLISVNIPNSVTSIGNFAFFGCSSLTSVTIPNSVTSIGDHAFSDCSNLKSLNIPDSVTSILWGITAGCTSLTELTVSENNSAYKSYENCIYTKDGTTLMAAAGGLTSVTILESVTTIFSSVFANFNNLTSVTIPDGVTSIGANAFFGCSNLTSVTIPNSVTSIKAYAFYDCSNLTAVNYKGTEEQWKTISIGNRNDSLSDEIINYNYTGE